MRKIYKVLFIFLVFVSLFLIVLRYGTTPFYNFLGYKQVAGLKITSTPVASVYIDGMEKGKTPYQADDLPVKKYSIELRVDDSSWSSEVMLNKGTVTVINRDISSSPVFAAGEVLSLLQGEGLVVTSNPTGASVEVDGILKGTTPLNIKDVSTGEHIFIFKHDGFLPRSVRATIPNKLLLSMNVDMAAAESLPVPTPTIVVTTQVTVKTTPTGFLRVRDKASLSGVEVARVSPGDKLTLIQDLGEWSKVETSDGKTGFVSSEYIQK